jgi:hypothetical protein
MKEIKSDSVYRRGAEDAEAKLGFSLRPLRLCAYVFDVLS